MTTSELEAKILISTLRKRRLYGKGLQFSREMRGMLSKRNGGEANPPRAASGRADPRGNKPNSLVLQTEILLGSKLRKEFRNE